MGIVTIATRCANPKCNKLTLVVWVGNDIQPSPTAFWRPAPDATVLYAGRLLPNGSAKPQPDFIPEALRNDYLEACLIRDLSPKASATLSRRCMQGMIRDFCSIAKGTLNAEIEALKVALADGSAPRGVTSESVDAIDHVRGIGNIGAHMEKDVNTIIPVQPREAEALTELIEMLFQEWYVERQARQERLAKITAIGAEKKQLKAATQASAAPSGTGTPTP